MKQMSILIGGMLVAAAAAPAQKPGSHIAGIDSFVNRVLKEWHAPGVSIAVVKKNQVVMTRGFGYRDYEKKWPVTENTLFGIGSCTKAFTAALLAGPVQSGRLDLDKPVTGYLPELRFINNELNAGVTPRDMLCHRSGLARHDIAMYSGVTGSVDSLVHLVRFMEPAAGLRQKFQYNNYMYAALGLLAEKLEGRPWETLVKEKIFIPLGMTRSGVSIKDYDANTDVALPYTVMNGNIVQTPLMNVDHIAPAGSINSTAKDMANWLLLWTNGGRLNGKEIIPAGFYTQAISPQTVAAPNMPTKEIPDIFFYNYGLGWYNASYRGHYGVGHGGILDGYTSYLVFFPADSVGIYVCANQNRSEVPRILAYTLADRMLHLPYRDWQGMAREMAPKMAAAQKAAVAEKAIPGAPPTHPLMALAGVYKNDAYGCMSITHENGRLTGRFNRWQMQVQHVHYNYFKFSVTGNAAFDGSEAVKGEFRVNSNGDIEALYMPLEPAVKDIAFKKQITAAPLPVTSLQAYTGEYNRAGTTIKIFLNAAQVLKATLPGQPEYELAPLKDDQFAIQGINNYSVSFERDDKGRITACNIIQPNGTFKAVRVDKPGKGQ